LVGNPKKKKDTAMRLVGYYVRLHAKERSVQNLNKSDTADKELRYIEIMHLYFLLRNWLKGSEIDLPITDRSGKEKKKGQPGRGDKKGRHLLESLFTASTCANWEGFKN